ncbi:amidohydrolase family protein [Engelhardtia mirabilis]|uniref:Imidazolonepropionase n=1 Tax=Engelhardtia mirabilis TaxID=2528011 RepID=A0A518BDM3_9BACT|nr:imidazolonepropionase [Planctomycetes bacterium Pla133]QDU99378.1 imidazolonepropionase [Planctomycetes bacterium Pla86]
MIVSTLAAACAAVLFSGPVAGPVIGGVATDDYINGVASDDQETKRSWTISADAIYTADGSVIENGFIRVQDGKIVAMGPGGPSGGDVIRVGAITPGLIDLSLRVAASWNTVEQGSEVTANMRMADAVDLFDEDWQRALRGGVTTALATPLDRNVIGGLGVALKTGGEPTIEARQVAADVVLRGCVGSLPSSGNRPAFQRPNSIFNRRPTTRMGVEWEARKAFYDAMVAAADESKSFPGAEQLQAAMAGELPFMVQAATTQDIRTTLFLKDEFGIPNLILDSAAEAWKEPQMVQRSGASVVLPPFTWDGRTDVDGAAMPWNTAAGLAELGVTFALSGHGSSEPDQRLSMQPLYAMRGGLDFDTALASVTRVPAEMIGISDRVGTLAIGKDADLCLWSGVPFEATSAVVGVMLEGDLVVDPRD